MESFSPANAVSFLTGILFCLGIFLGLCLRQTMFGEVAHFGVFCNSLVAKGVRFGPFQGKVVNASEVKTHGDNSLMWEVKFLTVGLAESGEGGGWGRTLAPAPLGGGTLSLLGP